jgi:hypothetical protein
MSISGRRGLFRNWPLKLAALFLSLTLYVAVAAQEQETQDFAMRLDVRIPPGRTMLSDPPSVRVTLRGKGGELLKLRLFRQVITLRVPDTLSSATWSTTILASDIELPKGADLQVADIAPHDVAIQLDPVASKEVRIVARVQVLPESGQALDGGLQITPSMARIVGPDRQVAAIDSVTTIPTELDVVRLAPKDVRVTGTTATVFERVFNLVPIESGAGPLTGYELQPARAAVTVRGPEALVQALTKDSLKVIVHLTSPVTDSATVQLIVVAPRGVTARASPDSVLIVRRRSGRG